MTNLHKDKDFDILNNFFDLIKTIEIEDQETYNFIKQGAFDNTDYTLNTALICYIKNLDQRGKKFLHSPIGIQEIEIFKNHCKNLLVEQVEYH